MQCARALTAGSRAGSSNSSHACRQHLQASGPGSGQRAARRRLAVDCKKRTGGGSGGGAAQQRPAVAKQPAPAAGGGGTSSIAVSPPRGYTLSNATLQQLDLGNIDKLEVRGNELVLTLKEPGAAAAATAAAAEAGSGSEGEEDLSLEGTVRLPLCLHLVLLLPRSGGYT
jgi:hypothetical protein